MATRPAQGPGSADSTHNRPDVGEKPRADKKEKFDPDKRITGKLPHAKDPKSYFPRFGTQQWHDFLIRAIAGDFLGRKEGNNTLKVAKAFSHFKAAAMGLHVGRQRLDVSLEEGDTPNISEYEMKSQANVVSGKYFSYNNPFSDHYQLLADQLVKAGMSTYDA